MKSLIRFIDQKGLSVVALILSDAFWYFLSFTIAYYLRGILLVDKLKFSPLQHFSVYFKIVPIILILIIIVFYFYGLYEKQNRITAVNEIILIIKATTFCLLLIMAGSFLQKYDYSRILIILFWIFSVIFMNCGRFFIRKFQRYLYKKNVGIKRILIIGAGKWGRKVAENISEYHDFGYKIIGFMDDKMQPKNSEYEFFGNTTNILKILKQHKINYVYIADPAMSHENILNLIYQCENTKVRFKVASDLFEIVTGGINLNEIEGMPTLNLDENQNTQIIYKFFKKIMDLSLSIIALLLTSPLFIIIIFIIRVTTKEPAIFIQKRVGQNNEVFKMYKFRTMYKDADENTYAPKKPNDQRITKVGRFLRKTSLDELPQLINVIRGEMSLVGPRPEMPFIVAKYKDWQKKRLEVKPGITGLWQILGRKDLPLHENLEYDFYYIKNQSILLDIVILLKTISTVIFQKGAY